MVSPDNRIWGLRQKPRKKVLDLIEEYNGASLFTFIRKKLHLNTDLKADLKIDPIEALDLMTDFFEKFRLESSTFNFSHYFSNTSPYSLTIRMLVESAKAGHWLYE
jgi:hypothetical protein